GGDRLAHDPAVDLAQQAVLLGDRGEGRGPYQLAVDLDPQVRLVQLAAVALQAEHRQVVQDEAVAGQGLAQALDPARDALFLGTVGRARVEYLDAVAAHLHRGVQAVAALGQDLRHAGDLLADLHAADAGGHRDRTRADAEHVGGDRV